MTAIMTLSSIENERQEELIGRGGFGKVFRVFSSLDDQYYAVKKIIITEGNIKSALHEIRILASMIHPNIIRYYHSWIESKPYSRNEDNDTDSSSDDDEDRDDIVVHHGECYFFNIQMEYCTGSLRQFLWDRRVIDERVCHRIITQVVEGLYFLHRNSVIHRDIKPDNILLHHNPLVVKISDFGLAKVFRKKLSLTESTTYTGSLLYASPEQYDGRAYSFSTDIYSLGVILLEIQQRFRTESERIRCLQSFRIRREIPGHTNFKDLILDMTHEDADARPTARQLHVLFNEIDQSPPVFVCRDIVWEIVYLTLDKLPV